MTTIAIGIHIITPKKVHLFPLYSIFCVSILVNILRWAAQHDHVIIVDKGNFPSGSHNQIICVNELPNHVTNGNVFKVVVSFFIDHLACDSDCAYCAG